MKAVKKLVKSETGAKAYYYFFLDGDVVYGEPLSAGGNSVSSEIDCDDYRYTHGGGLYRAATEMAKDLARVGFYGTVN
jgi:hypothetical protein